MDNSSIAIEMENRDCPFCKDGRNHTIYNECGFSMVKCDNCGYMYMNPIPTILGFKKIYNDKYEFPEKDIDRVVKGFEEGEASFFSGRLNAIKKYRKSGSMLDVGCNYGIFLKSAREAGYGVCGIDISKPAVLYGREKFGLDIIHGTIKEASFTDERFDIITMFDVLEHVLDPLEDLRAVNKALKKDGIFFMTTRNVVVEFIKAKIVRLLPFLKYYKSNFTGTPFEANEFGIPYHINYFTTGSLKKMLLKAGFRSLEFDVCQGYKYQGRHVRGFLRDIYTFTTMLFFRYFNIYIAAEISVCAKKR